MTTADAPTSRPGATSDGPATGSAPTPAHHDAAHDAPTGLDPKRVNIVLAILVVSAMAMILNETILSVALPAIMSDFSVSALTTGLFLLPGGIIQGVASPFIGRAYDAVGPRPLVIPGSAIMNTLQQLAGAAGTAVLVASMTIGAAAAVGAGATPMAATAAGASEAFIAGGIIGLIGLIFSPFVSKLDRVHVDLD